MNISNIELRHIVDVDGQLLGIDAPVVRTSTLLERANLPATTLLWLVRAGERIPLDSGARIPLSADDVLFFESSADARGRCGVPELLAA